MPFKPRNSRFYHYDFQIRGCRFHGSCGTEDFEEAKAIEAEARVHAKAGRKKEARYTLSEALGTYLRDVCQRQPSLATSESQGRMLLRFLDGKLYLDALGMSDMHKAIARMRATVSDSTINRRLDYLARALRHMANDYSAQVPEIDWKRLKVKERNDRVRVLSATEQKRLFKKLRPDLLPLVKVALLTGRRKAELCKLKWSDIDHETQRIRFAVKGGRFEYSILTPEVAAILSAQPRSSILSERPFVFTYLGEDGDRHRITPNGGHIWKLWREAVKEAEIVDFRFHDLRHTCATRLLRQTGNVKIIQRALGHKDVTTTARYAHLLDDDFAAAMNGFSGLNPEVSPEVGRKSLKVKVD